MPQYAGHVADRRAGPADGTLCRARLRTLLDHTLSPGGIRRLRPRIEALAEELVDALVARVAREGSVDLVAALAVPLPIMVIAEVSGIPADRRSEFRRWGDGMLSLVPEEQRESAAGMLSLLTETAATTAAGADGPPAPGDQEHAPGRGPARPEEALGLILVLLAGGYDRSAGMIAALLLGLLGDPEKFTELIEDPSLLPAVVDEFLRLHGALRVGTDRAEDVGNGAAARSAAVADGPPGPTGGTDPAAPRLDPGNELDRAQISVAVSTLLRRAGGLRLTVAPQDVPWRRAHCIRIPLRLPVTLTVAERGRE